MTLARMAPVDAKTESRAPGPERTAESLIEEIERYLEAVELFRALGYEPTWKLDAGLAGPVVWLIAPYIDYVSPV